MKAQSAEQEALQWATGWFRVRASVLTPGGSRDFLVEEEIELFLKAYDRAKNGKTDDKICVLDHLYDFEKKRFSPDLRREVAAALLERGEKLPDELQKFVVDYLRNPKTKRRAGRFRFKKAQRADRPHHPKFRKDGNFPRPAMTQRTAPRRHPL